MNKNIHLIYSNDSLVEMEYIKRFLEFIGFQVTIFPFDYSTLDSLYSIMNHSEKNCGKAIEIVLNYFELNDFFSNKFLYEIGKCNCEYYGIERFYLYFNFDYKFFYMNGTPLCKNENIDKDNNITKSELRYNVLNNLIEKLFKNNEIEKKSVKEILDCYFKCDNRDFKSNDDMFYLLSAKNNLDVINWSELNNESSFDKIYLNQYIKHIIDRLLELYKITSNKTDYFSLYTNINSALNIYDVITLLIQYDINLLVKEDNSIYQIINDCNNNKYILSKYDQIIENVSSKYDLINLLFLFKRMNEWCMDDEIELNIPLTALTIEVPIETNNDSTDGLLLSEEIQKTGLIYLVCRICSIISYVIAGGLTLFLIYLCFMSYKMESDYHKKMRKIFKVYDGIIVNVRSMPNISSKNIVTVASFEELIDAHSEIRNPINFIKEKDGATFMLVTENITYKYKLERALFSNNVEGNK